MAAIMFLLKLQYCCSTLSKSSRLTSSTLFSTFNKCRLRSVTMSVRAKRSSQIMSITSILQSVDNRNSVALWNSPLKKPRRIENNQSQPRLVNTQPSNDGLLRKQPLWFDRKDRSIAIATIVEIIWKPGLSAY